MSRLDQLGRVRVRSRCAAAVRLVTRGSGGRRLNHRVMLMERCVLVGSMTITLWYLGCGVWLRSPKGWNEGRGLTQLHRFGGSGERGRNEWGGSHAFYTGSSAAAPATRGVERGQASGSTHLNQASKKLKLMSVVEQGNRLGRPLRLVLAPRWWWLGKKTPLPTEFRKAPLIETGTGSGSDQVRVVPNPRAFGGIRE